MFKITNYWLCVNWDQCTSPFQGKFIFGTVFSASVSTGKQLDCIAGMPKLFSWRAENDYQRNWKSRALSLRPKRDNTFCSYFFRLIIITISFKLFICCTTAHNDSNKMIFKTYVTYFIVKYRRLTSNPRTLNSMWESHLYTISFVLFVLKRPPPSTLFIAQP